MKTWRGFGAGMLLLAVLTGCSGTTEPVVDEDEVQEWVDAQEADDVFGGVGGMAVTEAEAEEGGGASLINLGGDTVTAIEFSCFGEKSMTFDYEVRGDVVTAGTVEGLVCADGPHTIEVRVEGVTEIRMNGISPLGQGAWSATPRGES